MSKYLNFFDNNILLLFIYFFNFITLRVNFEILDTLLIFCFIFKKKKTTTKKETNRFNEKIFVFIAFNIINF